MFPFSATRRDAQAIHKPPTDAKALNEGVRSVMSSLKNNPLTRDANMKQTIAPLVNSFDPDDVYALVFDVAMLELLVDVVVVFFMPSSMLPPPPIKKRLFELVVCISKSSPRCDFVETPTRCTLAHPIVK